MKEEKLYQLIEDSSDKEEVFKALTLFAQIMQEQFSTSEKIDMSGGDKLKAQILIGKVGTAFIGS